MKALSEYRDPAAILRQAGAMARQVSRPWTLMEVCGGQTHSIVRHGLDQLLPPEITLLHGPGCPVCVTPVALIDQALALASQPEIIFCTFGDMLRVPGSSGDLRQVKAQGGDVRMVYSPLDALQLAQQSPQRQVVFFAVGFETTAPANAMAVYQAERLGLDNFSVLMAHVLVPPALEAILAAPDCRVQGFLAAGHVCTVMGLNAYQELVDRHRLPIVATGFEPLDILQGIALCLQALENGQPALINQYARAVQPEGNPHARALMQTVFAIADREWRGMGELPASGLELQARYAHFDARQRFQLPDRVNPPTGPGRCRSGEVLQGRIKPGECEAFGRDCSPEHPLGATMVSSEGACAAYYLYRRNTHV
ncbi:MAG: hydrogenase formation protein HypD [Candidatus Sericytochromatia bacterium]|nr:hydrogenase formation protein HypD [Candidatus Sericytochromatia bacterium]